MNLQNYHKTTFCKFFIFQYVVIYGDTIFLGNKICIIRLYSITSFCYSRTYGVVVCVEIIHDTHTVHIGFCSHNLSVNCDN